VERGVERAHGDEERALGGAGGDDAQRGRVHRHVEAPPADRELDTIGLLGPRGESEREGLGARMTDDGGGDDRVERRRGRCRGRDRRRTVERLLDLRSEHQRAAAQPEDEQERARHQSAPEMHSRSHPAHGVA